MSDDPLSEEFARWSSEDVVSSVVAELIEGAHAAASEKELASKARAYAVRGGTMAMLQAVRCYFLEADGGESSAAAQPTWAPDDEPAPASIDSWSRGAVASRKKAPPLVLPTPGYASSVASSGRSGRLNSPRSPRRPTEPAKEAPRLSSRPGAEQFKAPEKGSGGFGAPSKPKEEKPVMTPAEIRAAKAESERREELKQLAALKEEFKGRDYTYDNAGNVIVLQPVHPDRLGAMTTAVRADLAGGGPPPPPGKGGRGKGGRGGGRGARPAPAKRIGFSKEAEYKESESLQPNLTETMKVSDGVTLKEGETTVGGTPMRPPEAGPAGPRMSKRDFGATVATGGAAGGATSPDAGLGTLDPLAELPLGSPGEAPPPSPPIVEGGDPLMAKNWGVNPPMQDVRTARPPRVAPNPAKTLGVNRVSLPRERGGTGVKDRLPPPMLPAIAGHGLDPPYAPPPGAALDDPPSPDPPHLRSGLGERGGPPEIVKTANPELFNQLLGGK